MPLPSYRSGQRVKVYSVLEGGLSIKKELNWNKLYGLGKGRMLRNMLIVCHNTY